MPVLSEIPSYAHTLSGAFLPVLVVFVGGVLTLLLKKLEKTWKIGHEETQNGQSKIVKELEKRLAEAEGALRGDLKNGIKTQLDTIASQVGKVNERQGQTTEQNKSE